MIWFLFEFLHCLTKVKKKFGGHTRRETERQVLRKPTEPSVGCVAWQKWPQEEVEISRLSIGTHVLYNMADSYWIIFSK